MAASKRDGNSGSDGTAGLSAWLGTGEELGVVEHRLFDDPCGVISAVGFLERDLCFLARHELVGGEVVLETFDDDRGDVPKLARALPDEISLESKGQPVWEWWVACLFSPRSELLE